MSYGRIISAAWHVYFLPYKPGGCLKSCVSHPIPNAMIENGCSLVFPPWDREPNPSHAKHGMVIEAHPVASEPIKALMCFCLSDLWPKIEASRPKGRGFPERKLSNPDSFP
jgi:hypothetical protein